MSGQAPIGLRKEQKGRARSGKRYPRRGKAELPENMEHGGSEASKTLETMRIENNSWGGSGR